MQGSLSSLCRQGMGQGPSSRTTLAVVAAAAATLGAGCIDRESTPAARDDRDAAVVIRSAVASTEATWSNLWGSWPQGRYSHAMAYDSDRKVMVMYGARPVPPGRSTTTPGSGIRRAPAGPSERTPVPMPGRVRDTRWLTIRGPRRC